MSSTTERVPELLLRETKAGGGPRAFVKAHPMLTYFALTFLISWGGVVLVFAVGPRGFPVTFEQFEPFIPYWGLALVAGPALAGPYIGLYERVGFSAYFLWTVVLCAALWRGPADQDAMPSSHAQPLALASSSLKPNGDPQRPLSTLARQEDDMCTDPLRLKDVRIRTPPMGGARRRSR